MVVVLVSFLGLVSNSWTFVGGVLGSLGVVMCGGRWVESWGDGAGFVLWLLVWWDVFCFLVGGFWVVWEGL